MMRPALILGLLAGVAGHPGAVLAQGCGQSNPNCIVPTAPPGTSNNQAASTAFVGAAITAAAVPPFDVTASHTWTATNTYTIGPIVPTAAPGTSNTQAASTAFVHSSLTPPVSIVDNSVNWTATTAVDGVVVNTNSFPKSAYFGSNTLGVYSSVTGAVEVPSSSTQLLVNGVSGYCRIAGTVTNCVGVLGVGITSSDGSSTNGTWGANFVASNSPETAPVVSNTGFNFGNVTGMEVDVNIQKRAGAAPTGTAQGILINTDSEVQPTLGYYGILIAKEGAAPWKEGINIGSGAVSDAAILIGAQANAASTRSQTITFASYDASMGLLEGSLYLDQFGTMTANTSFVSIGTNGAIAHNPTSGPALFQMAPQAGQLASIKFFDGATLKWTIVKDATNNFAIQDNANSANAFGITSAGNIVLGEVGHTVTLVGTPTTGSATGGGSLCVTSGGQIFIKTTAGACL